MLIRLSPKPPSVKLTSGVCRTGSSKLRYLTHFLCMLFKLRDHIIFNMQSLKHRCNNPGSCKLYINFFSIFNYFFLAFDFCRFCVRFHSVFSSPPQRSMTSDFEGFLYQILSITLFSYLISWERASIFPFQCWVLNKGTTGTIFITSLVWRGPWLGIELRTFRTRSQHHITRLSRRRCRLQIKVNILFCVK